MNPDWGKSNAPAPKKGIDGTGSAKKDWGKIHASKSTVEKPKDWGKKVETSKAVKKAPSPSRDMNRTH